MFTQDILIIVKNLEKSEDKWKSVTAIIAAIKHYIEGHINKSIERRNFHRRIQQPGETFNNFLVSLCELVNKHAISVQRPTLRRAISVGKDSLRRTSEIKL